MPVPELKDCPRVLVVEGYSDLLFYAECLKAINKLEGVFIKQIGGKANLAAKLEAFVTPLLLAEKTHLGIIVDADRNPAGTFLSVQATVAKQTAQTVPVAGAWTDGAPRVGIFVTPDGREEGEIETLVWRAWGGDPVNAAARECVVNFTDCMKTAGHVAHSPDKGLVGALLAIRYDEDPRLGPGARERVFNLHRPEFGPLRTFLSGF